MIEIAVDDGSWKPLSLSRGGPQIEHLFFADDFFDSLWRSIFVAIFLYDSLLNKFSSLIKFYTSTNVSAGTIREICELSGMRRHCSDLGSYLGVPIHSERVSKATYRKLVEKVKNRLR